MTYDLAIIGAGPGGYVAALRAAALGARVLIIEKEKLGGVCLNCGCIPTKAMIASAHKLRDIRHVSLFGIGVDTGSIKINMGDIQKRKESIVTELRTGISQLLTGSDIEIMNGEASFNDAGKLQVGGSFIDAKNTLIATGSTWIDLKGIEINGDTIVTSTEALKWTGVPETLTIVGGGVIGCEFACMMSEFGSHVTIIEATESILPPVDRSISRLLAKSMKERGIEIRTNEYVTKAVGAEDGVTYELSGGTTGKARKMLVAVGRHPNTKGLNLEKAGVSVNERGFIGVDSHYKTSSKNIYAVGDVIGHPMLAHAASQEGIIAVEEIFGGKENHVYNKNACPSPIFTEPEIATVGRSAEELKKEGITFKTGRFPYLATGKARCDGETDGLCLVYTSTEDKILGVHMIGKDATTIIAEAVLAIQNDLGIKEVVNTTHSHPTLSEVFAEACEDAIGMAIHKLRPRKKREV